MKLSKWETSLFFTVLLLKHNECTTSAFVKKKSSKMRQLKRMWNQWRSNEGARYPMHSQDFTETAFRDNWNLLRSNVFLRLFFFTDRSECPFVAFRRIWMLHHPCHPLNPNSLEWQIHCYTAGPDSLGIKNQRAINTMLKSYSKYGFLPQ